MFMKVMALIEVIVKGSAAQCHCVKNSDDW